MPTVVQINTYNGGSTGSIAHNINEEAKRNGWTTYFYYGRNWRNKANETGEAKTGSTKFGKINTLFHVLVTRLFDRQGLASNRDTRRLINDLKRIKPDIIHLHNIHGYYLNYKILFKYLKDSDTPVVWTLHDCWTMTGHCAHFDAAGCNKWETGCQKCPQKRAYPATLLFERSKKNYKEKLKAFSSIKRLTMVPVSNWLGDIVKRSFLKDKDITVIHNGIDINTFRFSQSNIKEQHGIGGKKIVLGVAAPWSKRKGLEDFKQLYEVLPKQEYKIVMIGLSDEQIKQLPVGIIGLPRTNTAAELARWYSAASVFVNCTYEDNYPTTNLEAISCGTPVVTYKTGGSPESLTPYTGRIVEQGNIEMTANAIEELCSLDRDELRKHCTTYAIAHFDKNECFQKYVNLYESLLSE